MAAQQTLQDTEYQENQRRWVDGLNRGDVSHADEAFAPDCIVHITGSPVADLPLDGFKEMAAGLLAAFPDLRFAVGDEIVAGDKAARRWTAEGTNTGPLGDIPPTGKRMRIDGLVFDRVVDGKVVERWEQWDQPAMLRQLGLT